MRSIHREEVTIAIGYLVPPVTPTEYPIISGTIRQESRRAPSTTATITVATEHVKHIDPRTDGVWLRIFVRTGATDADPLNQGQRWTLYVTGIRRGFQPGTTQITAASHERRVLDYAPAADISYDSALFNRPRLREVVDGVLGTVNGSYALEAEPSVDPIIATNTGVDPDALIWRAGQSGYGFLQPLCQANGLRLYCDEQGRWTLRGEDYIDTSLDGYIVREGGNLIDGSLTDSIDQPGWCDAAVTRYTWRTDAGETKTQVDSFYSVTHPRVVARVEKDTPWPGDGYSEYLVNRRQARGRAMSATVQATWTERPDQSVALIMNDGTMTVGTIDSVGFDLTTGRASIAARTANSFPGTWIGTAGLTPDQTWNQAATIYPSETWTAAAGRTP